MSRGVEPEIDDILALARGAAEPPVERLERVRAALPLAPERSAGRQRRASGPRARRARHLLSQRARWLLGSAIWGALTAAIGFWLGGRHTSGTGEVERAERAPPAAPARVSGGEQPPRLDVTPSAASEGSPVVSSPAVSDRAAPKPPPRASRAPSAVAPSVSRASPQASRPPALGFREVLDLVRRAERARRAGELDVALALLDEADARAEPQVLRDERTLARVLCLCDRGDSRAARERADVLDVEAGSIYEARLRASCVGEPGDK